MAYNIDINDKKLKKALINLFGETLFDSIVIDHSAFNGIYVNFDNIENKPYDLKIINSELFIPSKYFKLIPFKENAWNRYPNTIPKCSRNKQWLVQDKDGRMCVAKFYDGLQGKYFYTTGNVYKLYNIVAFRNLPEKYDE